MPNSPENPMSPEDMKAMGITPEQMQTSEQRGSSPEGIGLSKEVARVEQPMSSEQIKAMGLTVKQVEGKEQERGFDIHGEFHGEFAEGQALVDRVRGVLNERLANPSSQEPNDYATYRTLFGLPDHPDAEKLQQAWLQIEQGKFTPLEKSFLEGKLLTSSEKNEMSEAATRYLESGGQRFWNDTTQKDMLRSLTESMREELSANAQDQSFERITGFASRYRILSGGESVWDKKIGDKMKKYLEDYIQDGSEEDVALSGRDMADHRILNAHEISQGSRGLEITDYPQK